MSKTLAERRAVGGPAQRPADRSVVSRMGGTPHEILRGSRRIVSSRRVSCSRNAAGCRLGLRLNEDSRLERPVYSLQRSELTRVDVNGFVARRAVVAKSVGHATRQLEHDTFEVDALSTPRMDVVSR